MRDIEGLLRFLAERAHMPFAWGRSANDCISFTAGAIHAQTGRTVLRGLRWGSSAGAMRLIVREGGLEPAIDRRLTAIAPANAMRGDVAGVDDELLGLRLMIVEGNTLVGPGQAGVERRPRSAMIRAWSAE